jgi:sulfur carrier protein ThiS
MARKKKVGGVPEGLDSMSVADLYALFMFVGSNRGRSAGRDAKIAVDQKFFQIEEELFNRAYGYDPFKKDVVTITGQKPEDVLGELRTKAVQTFIVTKNEDILLDEATGMPPQTFVVKKNETVVDEHKPVENPIDTFIVVKNE